MQLSPKEKIIGILALLFLTISQIIYFFLPTTPFFIFILHVVVALILLAYFLIRGGLEVFRSSSEVRNRTRWIRSLVKVALVVGVLSMVNTIMLKRELFELDTTTQKIHSLSEETRRLLDKLPAKLSIHAFYLGGVIPDEFIRSQLKALEKEGADVVMIDPESNPLLLERYGVTQQETLHFALNLPSGEQRIARAAHLKSEEQLNLVLKKLGRTSAWKILYSTGHGEPLLEDKLERGALFFKELLEGENLKVQAVTLSSLSKIERDISMLVINAPRDPFSELERRLIAEYIANGGNLLLFNEPRFAPEIPLLARPFGIDVGEDIILEPTQNTGLGIELRVLEFSKESKITRTLTRGISVTGCSSVRRLSDSDVGTVMELAYSSKNSWAERNLDLLLANNPVAAKGVDDLPGPVSIAASYDGRGKRTRLTSRVVVFGDSDFIRNAHLRELANGELILNSINWILGTDSTSQTTSRTMLKTAQKLTYEERSRITLLGGVLLPELLAILATLVWYRRQ